MIIKQINYQKIENKIDLKRKKRRQIQPWILGVKVEYEFLNLKLKGKQVRDNLRINKERKKLNG